MMGWEHGYGWGWFGALMMLATMVLFWGGLATVVIVLLRRFGNPGGTSDADRILEERFARGEFDEEELKRRRAALHRRS